MGILASSRQQYMQWRCLCIIAGLLLGVAGCGAHQDGGAGYRHPLDYDRGFTNHVQCEICGMNRNIWGRTRYAFVDAQGKEHFTCSINCVAALVEQNVQPASEVKVALYTRPEEMIPAAEAWFVVGSRAPGTMTGNSKLAFADHQQAQAFQRRYGGRLTRFAEALTLARQELKGKRHKGHGHGMHHAM